MKVIVLHDSEAVLPRAVGAEADLIISHNVDTGALAIVKNRTGGVGRVRQSDLQRLIVKALCPAAPCV